ncbi:MAG TPA: Ppx/GppA phosphatase family protein [Hyphomicrobiales bacterium]|nr:Ppx/GppA phosphatase family protein [Hyphomicrobiales bacterium]
MNNGEHAPGRLDDRVPVAVIDIGSNSVRLVVYEGARRSPTPIFNEKVLAGLGRQVASTGLLNEEGMERALAAVTRFRALAKQLGVVDMRIVATAAAREAENGKGFIAECEKAAGTSIRVLTGREEARLSGLGVVSGFSEPDGVAADLGGGSLELVRVSGRKVSRTATLPLGGLRLADLTGGNTKEASRMVKTALRECDVLAGVDGLSIYGIGGTFRALANLHMAQIGYPLHVMHHYEIPGREALDFARLVSRVDPRVLPGIDTVSKARRPLLGYGALVLEHLVRTAKPQSFVLSALGVREGLLYDMLDKEEQKRDPLLSACEELALLRSRSPGHVHELMDWTDRLFRAEKLTETPEERRLRHAACLLADVAWRSHPDYRGEQSLNMIAHAPFVGLDHPGRAYLALAVYYRHVGLIEEHLSPRLREIATMRLLDRARLLGAALRVAYLISAAAPNIIPNTPLKLVRGKLVLMLPGKLADLKGERLGVRMKALARLLGRKADITTC